MNIARLPYVRERTDARFEKVVAENFPKAMNLIVRYGLKMFRTSSRKSMRKNTNAMQQ